jgi:hypothetical protein
MRRKRGQVGVESTPSDYVEAIAMVNAALKHEVEAILERLPDTATLDDLLLAMQAQAASPEEEQAMIAQERDPDSALRQSLRRGLRELDAGEGIADEDLMPSLERRA